MRTVRTILMLITLSALAGCAITTPFQGPGYDRGRGVTIAGEHRLVVAVTEAVLRSDRTKRSTFWDYVSKVEASLPEHPGFVGYTLRRQIIGRRAWTLTVWSDEASLDGFVASDTHQAAIREAMVALECADFARFEIDRADIPVTWDRALAALAESGDGCD